MNITAVVLKSKPDKSKNIFPLSVSKAKTFDSCKAKYRFNYIEKLPRKDWEFHTFGNFGHKILENFHNFLLENNDQKISEVMTKAFQSALEEKKWKDKLTLDHKKEAKQIMTNYLSLLESDKKHPVQNKVIDVEKDFYININNSILLNGFIDRVQLDEDDILHVADYKTTKDKRYLKKDFFQLLTYAFVLMLENPNLEKIRASYIMLRHKFEYITQEYTRQEVMEVQQKFLDYAEKIDKEKLWRSSPQFLCKYCDFMDHCEDGKNYLIKRGIIKPSGFGLSKW